MSNLREYKSISYEFRRLASDLLRIKYTDKNVPLIRFKEYIDNNSEIHNIIETKIYNSTFDYNDYVVKEMAGWWNINIPKNKEDHIKAMYDYMTYIVDNDILLDRIAFNFLAGSNNVNDILQYFVELAFKPLIDFINDELTIKIIMLEDDSKVNINMLNSNQSMINLTGDNSTINSNITINNNDLEKISKLICDIKNQINNLSMNEEEKESIIDDIDIIDEQIKYSIPKPTRLKKAFNNIKKLLTNTVIATGNGIMLFENVNKLIDYLQPIINNIRL